MTSFRTLDSLQPRGKRVLVRVDLNVPMENGRVSDATRIDRILPTIREIADKGGRVILLAHFGRPKGGPDEANSLKPVGGVLSEHLGRPVGFAADCIGEFAENSVAAMADGEILLLENTRFHKGEEKNDPAMVSALAKLGDAYVNDAFSCAHRAHASTEGLARKMPAYAGRTMQAELEALDKALGNPSKPVAAIVGGAKVSTKLDLLGNLVRKVDILVIGGGMANTFLAARGVNVGKSLCEHDLVATAREIEEKAKAAGCEIVLPVDAVIADKFAADAQSKIVAVEQIPGDWRMLDVGPKTIDAFEKILAGAKTVVWNGPLGVFEMPAFAKGTVEIAKRLAQSGATTIIGGGDSAAAVEQAGVADKMTHISTGGGASLEFLEGRVLPGVAALQDK